MFLNEDLAEAIALGHDLGHTPFGHGGEAVLQEIHSPDFSHHKQSLRVVEVIENNGNGLNLTHEVRDGILKHSKGYGKILPDDPNELACTIEGRIVRIADIMAYLNHDLDDAIRSGVIRAEQVPEICIRVIGRTHQERATTMIRDLVFSSRAAGGELELAMSDDVFDAMTTLRGFMYENVYRSSQVHREFFKAKKILSELYNYLLENETALEAELNRMGIDGCLRNGNPREQVVCDFIASITDRYTLRLYEKIFFPYPTV
jgi:dGTPase